MLDKNANVADEKWEQIRTRLRNTNIRLSVLNPNKDKEHPLYKKLRFVDGTKANYFLIFPRGTVLELNNKDVLSKVVDNILESPIRRTLSGLFPEHFAVVLSLGGNEDAVREIATAKIEEACEQVRNVMPHMPKQVRHGPEVVKLKKQNYEQEEVLLWSLGINSWPEHPVAIVIYGRGRIMGGVIDYENIIEGSPYKYLSMIGADCECGLDRKWMLGHQIPLLWSQESQQELANEVGFDVDNPMILAEMSRILAKETQHNVAEGVSFGPETIDLSKLMDDSLVGVSNQKNEESVWSNLLFVIVGMILLVFLASFIIYKKRNSM